MVSIIFSAAAAGALLLVVLYNLAKTEARETFVSEAGKNDEKKRLCDF